ncbi:MAG TPA: SCO family protein [Gammaproteobacteria bacterium]|nr:SCO family protein [Gammaproteobacteria bacterium]
MRTVLAAALAFTAVIAALSLATDGFEAFTTESARRLEVMRSPRRLPDVLLEDQAGRRFRLSDLRGRPVVVEFIYTRCTSYCVALGNAFQQIQRAVLKDGLQVSLLSVSFDPDHDSVPRLAAYARRYGAQARLWRVARPVHPAALEALLDACGVKVISDGLGGYTHNAAILLVGPRGRLLHIYDWDAAKAALRGARRAALRGAQTS